MELEEIIVTIFIIFIFISLGIAARGIYLQYKRDRQEPDLDYIAKSISMSYRIEPIFDIKRYSECYKFFSKGYGPSIEIKDMIYGNINGVDVNIFKYRYVMSKDAYINPLSFKYYEELTVLLFKSNKVTFPSFLLCPERFSHKISSLFGYQDIDFESNPIFSKAYLLRGEDENSIRNLFGKELLRFLEKNQYLWIETCENELLYCKNVHVKPSQIKTYLENGLAIFNMFENTQKGL